MAGADDEQKLAEVEDMVLTWITQQKADVLETLYQVISLTLTEELKGKKKLLIKNLLDHFCSLEDVVDGDGGLSTFLLISDFIKKDVKTEHIKFLPVDNDSSKPKHVTSLEQSLKTHDSFVAVSKVRDFKISGMIAGKGDNKLSYTSLLYQIENGRSRGYSGAIVCDAVIKAISPSNNLRTYLESKNIVSVDYLLEILKSHFKEKDSNSVLIELSNAVQDLSESVLDFVLRLMCLREKALTLSKEEKCPLDEENLKKRFFQSMFTGMRNSNIRFELRERCKNDSQTSDELLLKYVSETCAQETERNEKFVVAKKNATVNLLNTDDHDSKTFQNNANFREKQKKDNPFDKINELKLTHQKEMSSIRVELQEIKDAIFRGNSSKQSLQVSDAGSQVNNYSPGIPNFPNGNIKQSRENDSSYQNFRDGGREYRRHNVKNRCQNCEMNNNSKCDHCFKCGISGHRSFQCSQFQKSKNE